MPITTFLHDSELNQPSGDSELDELLEEARRLSGRNYQVVKHQVRVWHLWPRPGSRCADRFYLYVEVGGVGPWQWMSSIQNIETVRAYLLGIINGCSARGPLQQRGADLSPTNEASAELEHAITAIGLALASCHNCVATDLPGIEPEETSWRIDNSKALERLNVVASRLQVSIDNDP